MGGKRFRRFLMFWRFPGSSKKTQRVSAVSAPVSDFCGFGFGTLVGGGLARALGRFAIGSGRAGRARAASSGRGAPGSIPPTSARLGERRGKARETGLRGREDYFRNGSNFFLGFWGARFLFTFTPPAETAETFSELTRYGLFHSTVYVTLQCQPRLKTHKIYTFPPNSGNGPRFVCLGAPLATTHVCVAERRSLLTILLTYSGNGSEHHGGMFEVAKVRLVRPVEAQCGFGNPPPLSSMKSRPENEPQGWPTCRG